MGRLLKIAVYIAVLFLLYLWIASVVKSCSATSTASAEDQTELTQDVVEGEEFEDEFFEDSGEEVIDYGSDEMGGGSEEVDSNPIDYTEVDNLIEEEATTYTEEKTPTRTTMTSGQYLLIAGNYLIETNAKDMVKKLRKIGYDNAEVVVFNMSQYYSVCAGRFSGHSTAQQESKSLQRKGIDNYVHTKH